MRRGGGRGEGRGGKGEEGGRGEGRGGKGEEGEGGGGGGERQSAEKVKGTRVRVKEDRATYIALWVTASPPYHRGRHRPGKPPVLLSHPRLFRSQLPGARLHLCVRVCV